MKKTSEEFDWTPYDSDRKELYQYYRSLGYDEQTATVLALFIFGNEYISREWIPVNIDRIYESLCNRSPSRDGKYEDEDWRNYWGGRPRPRYCIVDSDPIADGADFDTSKSGSRRRSDMSTSRSSEPASEAKNLFEMLFSEEALPTGPVGGGPEIPSFLRSGSSNRRSAGAAAAGRMSSRLPSFAMPATDEYDPIEEKDFRNVADHMTSTFRMTTNTASAGVIFNQLRENRRIDSSMVRIEEMLNYFRYQSPVPDTDRFRISWELMPKADRRKLLYINVQGKEEVKQAQNIILLLDVSGSMSTNAGQVQAMVATIISKLNPGDKLSLVTYSTRDKVIFRGLEIRDEADKIGALEQFLELKISGCTFGSAGIEMAYQIGQEEYIEGGNNQVILITDGDLNFGITDKGGLAELIEEKKKTNLFLSVIGTGLFNYKDDKLETLSKHGNGVYRVVNNLADVKKCINAEYASLVNVIAKDVKAQVEFNPEVVESFRLLGFENREISHEDFVNDKVISEPFGSGGYGVALYELVLRDGSGPVESGYKYARVVTTGSSELGTVKVRFKEPLADISQEIEAAIPSAEDGFTDNLRLAYVVYVCAEKLRGSDKIIEEDLDLAQKLYDELGEEIREMNEADLYKLPEILRRSKRELNVGIHSHDRFEW